MSEGYWVQHRVEHQIVDRKSLCNLVRLKGCPERSGVVIREGSEGGTHEQRERDRK